MAESVLRMKLNSDHNNEVSEHATRRRSIVSGNNSIGDNSPNDVLSGRLNHSNTLRHSTRLQPPLTCRLEQIEEELKSINGGNRGKHTRNNPAGIRTAQVEESKHKQATGAANDYDDNEDNDDSDTSSVAVEIDAIN